MESLAKRFPNVVKVIVGGKTYAGREIKGIEINYGSNLPGVLLEAGKLLNESFFKCNMKF